MDTVLLLLCCSLLSEQFTRLAYVQGLGNKLRFIMEGEGKNLWPFQFYYIKDQSLH